MPKKLVFHGVLREEGLIVGTGAVVEVGEAVRVGVCGPCHSQLLCLFIHLPNEAAVAL